MFKRILVAVLAIALFAALLTGCSTSGKEQVLNVNWQQEPPDMDPQTTTDQISFWLANATLEGLFRYQPDGTLGDGLAESYELSDDKLTYTFHLRDSNWSDGTPVTAEDFAFAWKRALDPDTASEYSYMLYYLKNGEIVNSLPAYQGIVEEGVGGESGYTQQDVDEAQVFLDEYGDLTLDDVGVTALDDKTLEVTLEQPTPYFLGLTTFPTYLPAQKAAVEQWGEEYALEAESMAFSGPFIISEWVHEQSLTLAKNPEYWDADSVNLETIHGVMITENNTLVQMYESGELDMINVPDEFYDTYKDSEEYGKLAQATSWYLMFNCEGKYFSNFKLREAFSMAVSKETFVEDIVNNMGFVAEGLVPPSLSGKGGKTFGESRADAGVALPAFDPEAAKAKLDEALTEMGATVADLEDEVTIIGGEGDTWGKYLQFLQGQFEQNLGVHLGIEQMSFAQRLDRVDTKSYEIAFSGWGGDYDDPMTFLDMWLTGGGNNDAYWSNETYDEAIRQAIAGEGDVRIDAYVEAERQIATDLPICPVYHPVWDFITKPNVKGIARFVTGSDYEFKWAEIK